MLPAGAIGPSTTKVLMAVLAQRRPTVRQTSKLSGFALGWTHSQLHELRRLGLVDWTRNTQGTLRVTAEVVDVPALRGPS